MKIWFICSGKLQERFLAEGVRFYVDRLSRYTSFELIEVSGPKGISDPLRQKEAESEALLKRVPDGAHVMLLDDKGSLLTSEEFSGLIAKEQMMAVKHLVFLCGGAYGFSQACYDLAKGTLSLGRMTYPHQLVRVVFVEQLYRAFTILRGEKYHHG